MSRNVIITGASSGIGRATALMFADAGWNVGLIARRGEQLQEMGQGRANLLPLPCDVTDEEAVDQAFAKMAERFGRLDVLFNNAGMFGRQATIDEISLSDWRAVIDVNLTGMFLCARAAFRQMRAQAPMGGRIINNGSLSAHSPRPGSVCYTSSKHAVTGLTRTLSLDGRAFGIFCGQIDIGNAETDMVAGLNARILANDPKATLMPVMDVEDAARAVLLMADMPASANVQFLTVMASTMAFIGRG